MALKAGDKLGPHEIISLIGKGGMGEVYRAHDPRTGRDVAIKVSADRFSERFDREVRAVAALNHPNICTLYGVGPNYLVMEYIEGEAPKGPLPLEEALRIARQISDALEEAHGKGIIHRDLKPANIKIKPDGAVKVLDFGLAKMGQSEPRATGEDSPTISMAATQAGMILGTAAYMSPEQARGKVVDKRADIWAFGVVFHELLTGRKLFQGDDITDTLASVIKVDPKWSDIPPQVARLLKSCLEKDPKNRLRDIGDVWKLLEDPLAVPDSPAHQGGRTRGWLWQVIAAVLALVAAAVTLLWLRASSPLPPPLMRFEVAPPAGGAIASVPQISPDGNTLAYVVAFPEKPSMIYIRPLSEPAERALPGTDEVVYCFWSPDGRSLAFTTKGRELKRIELAGGAPRIIGTSTASQNGTWGQQGDILSKFGGSGSESPIIQRMAASGGPVTPVTRLDEKTEETGHRIPQFLADGKRFLFYDERKDAARNTVELATLGSFERKTLLEGTSAAAYARDSRGQAYLLYKRGETLMAQRFDESVGALTGEAVAIADSVGATTKRADLARVSASPAGTLVYVNGRTTPLMQLTWLDRNGKTLNQVGEPGEYRDLALSPDGNRVAFASTDPRTRNEDIWVLDLSRGVSTRLTFSEAPDRAPVWSPDGKRIVFRSSRAGHVDLYVKASDGSGEDELLLQTDQDKAPENWSRDGRYLLYVSNDPKTKADLWVLPMDGDRKPFLFLRTDFNEGAGGKFSPDMRWISYTAFESGGDQVYVRPFTPPGPAPSSAPGKPSGGKWQISKDAGSGRSWWREDGKEILFVAPGGTNMYVDVTGTPAFHAGSQQALFQMPQGLGGMDVTRDLKKFLVAEPVTQNVSQPITVVLNWAEALKK